ncbi:hypothetical protein JCM19029_25860 [Salinicoccus sesuvii]
MVVGAVALIVVYFAFELFFWIRKRKITFYSDILAPVTVFILSIILAYLVRSIQEWSYLLPLVFLVGSIPVTLFLTLTKLGIFFIKKER